MIKELTLTQLEEVSGGMGAHSITEEEWSRMYNSQSRPYGEWIGFRCLPSSEPTFYYYKCWCDAIKDRGGNLCRGKWTSPIIWGDPYRRTHLGSYGYFVKASILNCPLCGKIPQPNSFQLILVRELCI